MTRTIDRKSAWTISGEENRSIGIESEARKVVLRLRPVRQTGSELGRVELVASVAGQLGSVQTLVRHGLQQTSHCQGLELELEQEQLIWVYKTATDCQSDGTVV